jgi:hypothetical protein
MAAELQQIVARIPPSMRAACRQDYGSPGRDYKLVSPDLSTERTCFHNALLVFMEMYVQGRAARSGRQGAIEG